uniref:Putative secreted protein n=1 Tax=Ixodes ricinus TaxID=34613 RepID=A0A6B0V634_IXORI
MLGSMQSSAMGALASATWGSTLTAGRAVATAPSSSGSIFSFLTTTGLASSSSFLTQASGSVTGCSRLASWSPSSMKSLRNSRASLLSSSCFSLAVRVCEGTYLGLSGALLESEDATECLAPGLRVASPSPSAKVEPCVWMSWALPRPLLRPLSPPRPPRWPPLPGLPPSATLDPLSLSLVGALRGADTFGAKVLFCAPPERVRSLGARSEGSLAPGGKGVPLLARTPLGSWGLLLPGVPFAGPLISPRHADSPALPEFSHIGSRYHQDGMLCQCFTLRIVSKLLN